ncbi:hypothetical protein D9613_000652 [Agrocybe pediades]|uniref:Uncharacterized protein n=1 Tax=Agrocybe pediades TaxID=84607 RepID=A0A8H4R2J0_9AGAR|nr:hypothetical protein D9613_000652 [Agrocybe pediades]KAF9566813.1 hypothetical protein CPC08DRAFT_740580 [Agrocybe pediades]
MKSLLLTLFLLAIYPSSFAGSLNSGDACSVGNNRLQTGTFQFWSECNSVSFCDETSSTCVPKRCRKDDFPFGYPQGSSDIPPKCEKGEFCPDEGSDCQPLLAIGSDCQLNRDDQCEAPPNFKELADTSGRGLNFNGSVCLNNKCYWANATLGTQCVFENTPYIAYGVSGEFIDIVSRGNCKIGLYCDSGSSTCMKNKLLGDACTADKECDSWNCLSSGVCGETAATPHHFGTWVYVLVALGIIGGMSGTLTGLYFAHRKQREQDRAKRAQYWREQNAFHQNLMQMRETARASILSLKTGGRGNEYGSRDASDESHSNLQPNGPKASGLRNYIDDGSSEMDDSLMMHSGRKMNEGRF